MIRARPIKQSGEFVPGQTGCCFRLLSEPSDGALRGTIVFVHGFAEEMNKSRRMVARMARLMAADGWRVVQRDLSGCGDSSGDFEDATWSSWIADVDTELTQAVAHGPVWLWGLRAGALLASPTLLTRPKLNLLLWQPVMSGAQHLQQFLRLNSGARIVGLRANGGDPSPSQLLRSGSAVEVAGYVVAPALAEGLDHSKFDVPAGFMGRIIVFELSPENNPQPSPGVARLAERLHANGIVVESHCLTGPTFWQTQEIEECDLLLEQTLAVLRTNSGSSSSLGTPAYETKTS